MWLQPSIALAAVTLLLSGCGGGSTHRGSSPAGTTSPPNPSGSGQSVTSIAAGPANGVARRTPNQIVAAASRAIELAHSVHVVGSVVDNGIQVRLDLHLSRGHGGQGEVSENGLGFRLISTGRVLYIQGSDAFWSHFGGASATRLFRGKWLKAPDAGQFGTLGRLATTQGLVGQLLSRHGKLFRAGRTTVDGQPAVGVVDRTQGGTLFVATTGKPYPLEVVKRGADGGFVRFTDFNQPVTITIPSKSINLPSAG
jgi:hypothetical protein